MKRLLLVLTAGLATAALIAGTGAGAPDDTKGPPCGNIVNNAVTDYYNPSFSPHLQWTFVLDAGSCASITYKLEIYSFDGTTLLDSVSMPGNGSTNLVFNYNFTGTPPSDGVCLVGTSTRKTGRVADRAPDTGCFPVEHGGAGQSGGFG
jgi:hypothetical protein